MQGADPTLETQEGESALELVDKEDRESMAVLVEGQEGEGGALVRKESVVVEKREPAWVRRESLQVEREERVRRESLAERVMSENSLQSQRVNSEGTLVRKGGSCDESLLEEMDIKETVQSDEKGEDKSLHCETGERGKYESLARRSREREGGGAVRKPSIWVVDSPVEDVEEEEVEDKTKEEEEVEVKEEKGEEEVEEGIRERTSNLSDVKLETVKPNELDNDDRDWGEVEDKLSDWRRRRRSGREEEEDRLR